MSQGRPTVDLVELGAFVVQEPSLAGYEAVLAALPAEAYDGLHRVIVVAWHAPPGAFRALPEDAPDYAAHEKVRNDLMDDMLEHITPIVRLVPRVLSALLAACLRRQDGERLLPVSVDEIHKGMVPSKDVKAIVSALIKANVLDDIVSAVKNLTAPARPAAAVQ
ncbi:MAG TPA: hypothetical protein VMW48_10685 [Vicinamibacterales bacterium]|nr:hypothetical protein [Vicinamibacterales bacterium]